LVDQSSQPFKNEYLRILRGTAAYPSFQEKAQRTLNFVAAIFRAVAESAMGID